MSHKPQNPLGQWWSIFTTHWNIIKISMPRPHPYLLHEYLWSRPRHQHVLKLPKWFQGATKFLKMWAWRYLLMCPKYSSVVYAGIKIVMTMGNAYDTTSSATGQVEFWLQGQRKADLCFFWILLQDDTVSKVPACLPCSILQVCDRFPQHRFHDSIFKKVFIKLSMNFYCK